MCPRQTAKKFLKMQDLCRDTIPALFLAGPSDESVICELALTIRDKTLSSQVYKTVNPHLYRLPFAKGFGIYSLRSADLVEIQRESFSTVFEPGQNLGAQLGSPITRPCIAFENELKKVL